MTRDKHPNTEASSTAQLWVRTLGGFVVRRDGVEIPADEWALRRAGSLFKYLLVAPRMRLSRETAIEALWPGSFADDSGDSWRARLRQCVYRLHKVLDGPDAPPGRHSIIYSEGSGREVALSLAVRRDGRVLSAEEWLDAAAFERDAKQACGGTNIDACEAALELYHGPFLPDDQGLDADWEDRPIEGIRLRLADLYTRLRLHLADLYIEAHKVERAERHLRAVLQGDPTDEDATERLVKLLESVGRPGEARRVYAAVVEALRQLDVAPRATLTALYARLHVPAAPARPSAAYPTNLPAATTRLVGRQREREDVRRQLDGARLVTLTGTGGCGKTQLALAVARDVLVDYPDGVWLVELASFADPALVVGAVAAAVRVREEMGQHITETLRAVLAPRRLLVVLDNCEHLIAACAALADGLLQAAPGLRILATSREPLDIAGEVDWKTPPLATPPAEVKSPDEICRFESVQLFMERAPRLSSAPFASTVLAIAEVCRRLDGIPLAIELAAARTTALTPYEIASRLDDRFRLLTRGHRTALERHQTLRAALDWSYDLLGAAERALLRHLAVFAGGCTLLGAEAVCAGDPLVREEVLDLLDLLVRKSLVVAEDGLDGMRYRLLETIRLYAHMYLEASGEAEAVRGRHTAYYRALAEEAEPHLLGEDQGRWLDRLEGEHDNLRAALTWAGANGDVEMGLRLAGALWRFWATRGNVGEGRRWFDTLLGKSEGSNSVTVADDVRAKALNGSGMLALHQGDHARATALHEESLMLSRALGDVAGVAGALNNLALIAYRQGDYARAAGLFKECLTYRREANDGVAVAMALNNLAVVAELQGDYSRALALQEESLVLRRAAGHTVGIAGSTGNLGTLAYQVGDLERAERLHQESLVLQREVEHKRGIAVSLNILGLVAYQRGDYERAWSLLQESLALYRDLGDTDGIAGVLVNLGAIARAQGDVSRAVALYRESVALSFTAGAKGRVLECLDELAQLADAAGQARVAARLFGATASLRDALGALLPPVDRPTYERAVAHTRATLGDGAFSSAWMDGQGLSPEQAVIEAARMATALGVDSAT